MPAPRIERIDQEDFDLLLNEITQGHDVSPQEIDQVVAYAYGTCYERYQLLLALRRGYCAQQERISRKNQEISTLRRILKEKGGLGHGKA